MVVNETRRRLLRQLNSRYIFGKYVRGGTLPRAEEALAGGRRSRDVVHNPLRSEEREAYEIHILLKGLMVEDCLLIRALM